MPVKDCSLEILRAAMLMSTKANHLGRLRAGTETKRLGTWF